MDAAIFLYRDNFVFSFPLLLHPSRPRCYYQSVGRKTQRKQFERSFRRQPTKAGAAGILLPAFAKKTHTIITRSFSSLPPLFCLLSYVKPYRGGFLFADRQCNPRPPYNYRITSYLPHMFCLHCLRARASTPSTPTIPIRTSIDARKSWKICFLLDI